MIWSRSDLALESLVNCGVVTIHRAHRRRRDYFIIKIHRAPETEHTLKSVRITTYALQKKTPSPLSAVSEATSSLDPQ